MTDDASPAEPSAPAWRRETQGEQRWWLALAIAIAIVLHGLIPSRFALHPRFLVECVEVVALVALTIAYPKRMVDRSNRLRVATVALLGLIAATNAVSVVLLIREITSGQQLPATDLLLGGIEIWFANALVFALWYWEYDRGGPAARARGVKQTPDFLFPQMTDETLDRDWEPIFFDYLFVSYTNQTAFSPTDTLPLSRWAKLLFIFQSALSLVTVALIAARAVNILPGS